MQVLCLKVSAVRMNLFFVSTYKFIGGLLLLAAGVLISKVYTGFGMILTAVGILVVLPQALMVWVSVYRQLKESSEQKELCS